MQLALCLARCASFSGLFMSKIIDAFHRIWFWLLHDTKCSWCQKTMHRAALWRFGDGMESHGQCPACAKKFIDDLHEIEAGNALTTAAEHNASPQGRWTGNRL